MVQLVFPNVYHPLDNAIQLLNNWGNLISGYCTRVLQHLSNLIALPNQVQTFDSDIFVLCLRSSPWISYFLLRAQSCCPILGLLTEGVVIVFTAEPLFVTLFWWTTKRAKRLSQVPIHSIKVDLSMFCLCLLHSQSAWQMHVLCM